MQPQFIIDAIKHVIREPSADNVNDEVRKNEERIRQRSADRGDSPLSSASPQERRSINTWGVQRGTDIRRVMARECCQNGFLNVICGEISTRKITGCWCS